MQRTTDGRSAMLFLCHPLNKMRYPRAFVIEEDGMKLEKGSIHE